LCAAPGGKTMQLAAAGHGVTAVDASANRLGRLRENLERTHLSARLVEADVLVWEPGRRFDAILLDAPCSATGTFRRHPEVLHRAGSRLIEAGAERQAQLLDRAVQWLAPHGMLIYSVCSLEPEEGEQTIAGLLGRHPECAVAPPKPGELPEFVAPSSEGWVRILPGLLEAQGGLDGFFIARLVRAA
jgi:16S rRNA (cytosine967-C5)-methyltransferase